MEVPCTEVLRNEVIWYFFGERESYQRWKVQYREVLRNQVMWYFWQAGRLPEVEGTIQRSAT